MDVSEKAKAILEGNDPRSVLEQKEPKGPRSREEIERLMVDALEQVDWVKSASIQDPNRSEVARVALTTDRGKSGWLRSLWEKENGQIRFFYKTRTVNPLPSIITPENPSDQEIVNTIVDKMNRLSGG